jgi:hypothetical protein
LHTLAAIADRKPVSVRSATHGPMRPPRTAALSASRNLSAI